MTTGVTGPLTTEQKVEEMFRLLGNMRVELAEFKSELDKRCPPPTDEERAEAFIGSQKVILDDPKKANEIKFAEILAVPHDNEIHNVLITCLWHRLGNEQKSWNSFSWIKFISVVLIVMAFGFLVWYFISEKPESDLDVTVPAIVQATTSSSTEPMSGEGWKKISETGMYEIQPGYELPPLFPEPGCVAVIVSRRGSSTTKLEVKPVVNEKPSVLIRANGWKGEDQPVIFEISWGKVVLEKELFGPERFAFNLAKEEKKK